MRRYLSEYGAGGLYFSAIGINRNESISLLIKDVMNHLGIVIKPEDVSVTSVTDFD